MYSIVLILGLLLLFFIYRYKIKNFIQNSIIRKYSWNIISYYTYLKNLLHQRFGKKGIHIEKFYSIDNTNITVSNNYIDNSIAEIIDYSNNKKYYINSKNVQNTDIPVLKKNSNIFGGTLFLNKTLDGVISTEIDCTDIIKNFIDIDIDLLDFSILILKLNNLDIDIKNSNLEILHDDFSTRHYNYIINEVNEHINF